MGRAVNFEAVPDTGVVDPGIYQVSIVEIEETASRNGKLMYKAHFEIVEPTDFAGMGIFESFVIGNDDDPDAAQDATWVKSVGSRRMKQMFKAAQVPMDNDMDNIIAAALQQNFVISVTQEVDDGKNDPQYLGRVRNRISAFYQLGTKEVGATSTPKQVAKAPAPAAPKPPTAPKPPLAVAPKAPPPAPPKAAAPATSKKSEYATCTICNPPTQVLRSEFADHVDFHANEA